MASFDEIKEMDVKEVMELVKEYFASLSQKEFTGWILIILGLILLIVGLFL